VSQGLKLHFLDWGNADKPLLILVHGSRDHARSWDWTARALRDDWHVVAYDLRGHGDSQWSSDGAYHLGFHVCDLAELVDLFGQDQATIIAHSLGGGVSGRYAGIHPERVRKLVIVDGLGPSPKALQEWGGQDPLVRVRDWVDKRRDPNARRRRRLATVEEAVERMATANPHLSDEQVRHLAVHGICPYEDGYSWKYDPLVFTFAPEDFSFDSTAFWRAVEAPTLICWGSESVFTDPDNNARASYFRDHKTFEFDQAGHWPHHDRFDAFIGMLKDFL
jgi:pimeloyl-ACP methyl ester carboxylesterase